MRSWHDTSAAGFLPVRGALRRRLVRRGGPLSTGFRVCALDFPGYGFSDKPQGRGYSLTRDAELIEFYLSQVLGAEAGVIVAHDRGDSVALVACGPVRWRVLTSAPFPVTMIWGLCDTVSPPRVASYVWNQYLMPAADLLRTEEPAGPLTGHDGRDDNYSADAGTATWRSGQQYVEGTR